MRTDYHHEIPRDAKIYIAGHRGMVGSAIWRRFEAEGYTNLIGRRSRELDLTERDAVFDFFSSERPAYLIDAAAKVGGIFGNDAAPADFLSQNLRIQVNLLDAAKEYDVTRALFLGSSCIYPTNAVEPIHEDSFMTGPVEQTNFGYAIAKITGVMQVQALRQQFGCSFISAMPCNLYGIEDNFQIPGGHAFPMILRRLHEATVAGDEEFTIYGSGKPRREFLNADDVADACLFLLKRYDDSAPINIGAGTDIEINELTRKMATVVGFNGAMVNDTSKADGVMSKLMDSSRIRRLGWEPKIGLTEGIESTYKWFLDNQDTIRR